MPSSAARIPLASPCNLGYSVDMANPPNPLRPLTAETLPAALDDWAERIIGDRPWGTTREEVKDK